MTKKKKVVTPLKDVNVSVVEPSPESAMQTKSWHASVLDGQYHYLGDDSGTTEAEYQNIPSNDIEALPESIVDSLMRPEPVVDQVNREINEEYPWVVSSITTTQRAMLCELVRIRHLLEKKNA